LKWTPFKTKNKRFTELLPSWRTNQDAKFNDWTTEKAISEGLKASTYVYACIQLIARSVASVPWYVYKQKRNGDWEQIKMHPLELLIEKPTPFHSRKDLMEGMVQHLYLGGNALFTKVRASGTVAELWQLPPDAIKVIPSRKQFIDHYEYNRDGVKQKFKQTDIIHSKFNDPSNLYWGLSPLQAGARTVDSDIEAVKFQKVSLQNRAITDGIFTFEHPLTKDQWEEARSMVREQHQGIQNARTPWVLGAGAKWTSMSLSPAEMDFLNSRKFSREEICSIFNVPPPMIGILENSTYNNIETARKIFWQDALVPLLQDIKNTLNLSLTPEFGTGITLDFDLSSVDALQTSSKEKLESAKVLFSMGVPFNDINQRLDLGFDPIEGGDMGYLPSGLMPANLMELMEAPSEDPPPTDPPADPEDPPANEEDEPKGKDKALTKNTNANGYKRIGLSSEKQKLYYFEQVDRMRSAWVVNMTRKSARLFKQEGDLLASAVTNGKDWKKVLSNHEEAWERFLSASYQAIVEEIGKDHFANLVKAYKPMTKEEEEEEDLIHFFNPHEEDITKYIVELAGTKVTNVSDWTRQIVGALVLDAQENNLTMDELAKNIKSEFKEFSRYRAYRIARTEAQNALGFAHFVAGEKAQDILGVKIIGEWITSGDDRVRDSHEKLHGTKAKIGEAFPNGLKYAGEYTNTGEARDNINCRCVIVHHFE